MVSAFLTLPVKVLHPIYARTSFHRAVIEEISDPGLRGSYAFCRSVTRQYAKTFYFATRFLPRKKQRGIFAVYALCRFMDNLVDNLEDMVEQKGIEEHQVASFADAWKHKLLDTYQGKSFEHPILMALSDVLRSYQIDVKFPLDLLDGVTMDLRKKRYATFEELYEYCYKVASVVGLMTSEIFGYSDKAALEHAEALGIAMQLTNILRDVKEDAQMGRIYLPQEELAAFGVSENDILENRFTPEFKALIRFQVDRAKHYYDEADKGIVMLSRDSRMPVALARYNYARILDKIVEIDYNVFKGRVYLTGLQKLKSVPRAAMRIF